MIPENEKLDGIKEELMSNLKEFRERAENRVMDKSGWNTVYRIKLKALMNKMLDLQVELNEL